MAWVTRIAAWVALAVAFALSAPAHGADKVIVFDLDCVVLYHPGPDTPPSKILRVETDASGAGDTASKSDRYRVAEGFPELLQSLVARGWKVNVFSFGKEVRNTSAMKAIRLPDGTTAYDAITRSGGKVFSSRDGFNMDPNDPRVEYDNSVPKEKRPRIVKYLSKVLGPEEAAHAVIVDDIPSNIHPTERTRNTVFLPYQWPVAPSGEQLNFYQEDLGPTERALLERGDFENLAAARERFRRQQTKIPYLAGLLDKAEEVSANTGKPINEVLEDLQYQRGDDGKVLTDKYGQGVLKAGLIDDVGLIARGRTRLREVREVTTPARVLPLLVPSGGCRDTMVAVGSAL